LIGEGSLAMAGVDLGTMDENESRDVVEEGLLATTENDSREITEAIAEGRAKFRAVARRVYCTLAVTEGPRPPGLQGLNMEAID
jgi:hypothetical protein